LGNLFLRLSPNLFIKPTPEDGRKQREAAALPTWMFLPPIYAEKIRTIN
jgi:hypothetical protein